MNFWYQLPKPIIGLAPMDGITDYPFRYIIQKYGSKCNLFFTEFVHVEGLIKGKLNLFQDLYYVPNQKPIVAQLFGNDPKYFYQAAIILCFLGFDGIDINMGCPAKSVIKKNGGAALIKSPKLAQEIIKSTQLGITDYSNGKNLEDLDISQEKIDFIKAHQNYNSFNRKKIPVSVKTRLGYSQNTISEWIKYLIEAKPNAITIHGRTFSELYSGQADWDAIASVSSLIHNANITYLGNGDVKSLSDAYHKAQKYQVDGVLIGRSALGNPWIFSDTIAGKEEKISLMLEHAEVFHKFHQGKHFYMFRKNISWYCRNFPEAKNLRQELIQAISLEELKQKLNNI